MATSGGFYLEASGSTGANAGYFSWNLQSQSTLKNTSTIKFKLNAYRIVDWYSYYTINNVSIISFVDGQQITVYSKEITDSPIFQQGFSSATILEDSFEFPHDLDGTKTNTTFWVQYTILPVFDNPTGNDGYGWKLTTITLPTIKKVVSLLTASNFTDEENPTITYSIAANTTLDGLEAGISSADGLIEVPYRAVPMDSASYTFDLTEEEREALRLAAKESQKINVKFILKATKGSEVGLHTLTRTLTIVGCEPIINNPVVRDVNSTTAALTGDDTVVVSGESMMEYSFTPVASKAATIVSQSVQCGNTTITGLSQGVIDDVESNLFIFSATDSRGLTATEVLETGFVDYLRPTCYQKLTSEIAGETGAKVELTISGSFFNGSFGAVDNTLKLEVRHTQNDGEMGEWIDLSPLGYEYNGNTYELKTTITGLTYSQAYTFQCRATDKLHYVQSAEYVVKIMPVFDWGNEDFNFNVPINMNDETVLRHNKEANNTVLSGSGGHIYLRPGGTDDTSYETILYPDGKVGINSLEVIEGASFADTVTVEGEATFNDEVSMASDATVGGSLEVTGEATFKSSVEVTGEANFIGGLKINGEDIKMDNPAADYVVATGSTSMGSNGTWYWEKWNSGKSVCWGFRNYGRMAVTTSFGYMYSNSDYITQTLPSGLFSATQGLPVILGQAASGNCIVLVIAGIDDFSFSVLSPTSTTLASSNISFHATGRWK